MPQRVANAISLTRKAGKLVMGFDPVKDNVLNGKAVLVMTASDLSPKTAKRVEQFCEDWVPILPLPLTQFELADVAHKPVGVFAVLDPNLAKLCKNAVSKYQAAAAAIHSQKEEKSE